MKPFLALICLTLFISACSTPHKPIDDKNSKHTGVLVNNSRLPSELKDFYLDDGVLTQDTIDLIDEGLITNDSQISTELEAKLTAIIESLPITYGLLLKFDEDLDKKLAENQRLEQQNLLTDDNRVFSIENNEAYRKLQILRSLMNDIDQQVASSYAYTWMIYKGTIKNIGGLNDEMMEKNQIRARAKNYLRGFHILVKRLITKGHGVSAGESVRRRIALNKMGDILYVLSLKLKDDIDAKNKDEVKLFSDLRDITKKIHFANEGRNSLENIYTSNLEGLRSAAKRMENSELAKFINDEIKEQDLQKAGRIPQAVFKSKNGNDFGKNKWVLTFDDGPHATRTADIVKVLEDNNLRGEFFWLSKLVAGKAEMAKEMFDNGHHISSHSTDHSDLTCIDKPTSKHCTTSNFATAWSKALGKMSAADRLKSLDTQVAGSRDVITKAIHDEGGTTYKMVNFRCPYGACVAPKSTAVQNAIANADLTHISWNVDSLDYSDVNTKSVLDRVLKQMKANGRGIILFHDIHPRAAKVLPLLFTDKYVTSNKVEWLQL